MKPTLQSVPPAHHGAFDYAELERLGLHPDEVLDFSVNSNPFGPSPRVREAMAAVPLDRYPDRESIALRRALSERLGVSTDRIVTGNGTAELLWLLAFALLAPGDTVLIIGPTFGEYSRVSALMGAQVEYHLAKPNDFAVNPAEVSEHLRELQPKLVFLCNPNNPTGTSLRPETVGDWAAGCPEIIFVVDESYLNFADSLHSTLGLKAANILSVRSMTKDYALAGLRLGYAAAHNPTLIEAIAAVRPAWNVSGLAQAAGLAALRDEAYMQKCLSDLRRAKSGLVDGLTQSGWSPLPSTTHFFLMNVGQADTFRLKLLQQAIQVRDCASFGLPRFVRIATRRPEENERLLVALKNPAIDAAGKA